MCYTIFFFFFFFFLMIRRPPTFTLFAYTTLFRSRWSRAARPSDRPGKSGQGPRRPPHRDRKSTRLDSSHVEISYAVFCLKKKKKKKKSYEQNKKQQKHYNTQI